MEIAKDFLNINILFNYFDSSLTFERCFQCVFHNKKSPHYHVFLFLIVHKNVIDLWRCEVALGK
jgi:hypothetical protein